MDQVLANLDKHQRELMDTFVGDAEHLPRVQSFVEALTAAARLHRNWNETMKSIDGMIDYDTPDEEFPEGYRLPAVDRNDYTGYEEAVEEAFYTMTCAKLKRFKIQDFYLVTKMIDNVSDVITYSTKYDDYGFLRD